MQHDSQGTDILTDLPTTQVFVERATQELAEYAGSDKLLVFFNILNFKNVNAELGYHRGDEVLVYLARLLEEVFPGDLVARLSDDKFVVFTTASDVEDRVSSIYNRAHKHFADVTLRVIAGIYMIGEDDTDINIATDNARIACDSIKDRSLEYMRYYDKGLSEILEKRQYVIDHLDEAIDNGEIKIYYQPVIRVLTGRVCGVEALARWVSPKYGLMTPDFFIDVLERNRLIHKLDLAILRRAASQFHRAKEVVPFITGSVNLSRLDFELCDVYDEIEKIMREFDVPKHALHVEVTESVLTDHSELVHAGIEKLRANGYEVWMDDFGSGYSSLNTLGDSNFDVVKFDMGFMRNLSKGRRSRIVFSDAVNMIKQLGMNTLTEGVETEEQLEFLKTVGCDKAQGYLFGKPMCYEDIVARFADGTYQGETHEDLIYYRKLSSVNVLAPDKIGEEFDNSVGYSGLPTAIVEIRGQRIETLAFNDAFNGFLADLSIGSLNDLPEHAVRGSEDMVSQVLFTASESRATGEFERFDFMLDGNYCDLNFKYIASNGDRSAYLVQALNLSRFSAIERTRDLEASLRFLHSIYERIDMFDFATGYVRNIHRHASVYHGLSEEWMPIEDEIDAYEQLAVHPDDRERHRNFFNEATIRQRLENSTSGNLCTIFRTLDTEDRYSDSIYTLIPMVGEGTYRILSCVRRARPEDYAALGSFDGGVSDSKLLSALLNHLDRPVFWLDDQRRYLGANQKFLEYANIGSLADIIGKTGEEVGFFAADSTFVEREEAVLREGVRTRETRGELELNGRKREILASKMPLYHGTQIVGLLGFFHYADE